MITPIGSTCIKLIGIDLDGSDTPPPPQVQRIFFYLRRNITWTNHLWKIELLTVLYRYLWPSCYYMPLVPHFVNPFHCCMDHPCVLSVWPTVWGVCSTWNSRVVVSRTLFLRLVGRCMDSCDPPLLTPRTPTASNPWLHAYLYVGPCYLWVTLLSRLR